MALICHQTATLSMDNAFRAHAANVPKLYFRSLTGKPPCSLTLTRTVGGHRRLRCHKVGPALALFGDLLQRFGPGPSWSWQTSETEPSRATLVDRDVQVMRHLLEVCRREKELEIPSLDDPPAVSPLSSSGSLQSLDQQEAIVTAALHADPSCAASNAVPFSSGNLSPSDGHSKEVLLASNTASVSSGFGSSGLCSSEGQGAVVAAPRVETVRPILPCLFAAEGKLDAKCAEFLAGRLALSRLQLLNFARIREGQARCLPDNVFWCGPGVFPSPRVAGAAMLHRMVVRRGGLKQRLPQVAGDVIVMAYPQQDRQLAAESLALYLHLYCNFDLELAAKETGLSMGTAVHPEALVPCLKELTLAAAGWEHRVKLVWPYGGGRVELSGEAVGGWDRKASLGFDVRRRHWVLWFWGLSPGVYRCKFIVDGRWCIDMAAPTEYDGRGNVNNVIAVPEGPLPSMPGREMESTDIEQKMCCSVTFTIGGSQAAAGMAASPDRPAGQSTDGRSLPPAPTLSAPERTEMVTGMLGIGAVPLQLAPGQPSQGAAATAAGAGTDADNSDLSQGAAEGSTMGEMLLGAAQVSGSPGNDIAKFGALLLAFCTKLVAQRRVAGGHS